MSPDLLPGLWSLSPIGALVGLLVFLTLSLARGWVITKSSHERELALANKRGDEWKETAEKASALAAKQSEQIGKFADSSKTSAEFFGTVSRTGGDHAPSKS